MCIAHKRVQLEITEKKTLQPQNFFFATKTFWGWSVFFRIKASMSVLQTEPAKI